MVDSTNKHLLVADGDARPIFLSSVANQSLESDSPRVLLHFSVLQGMVKSVAAQQSLHLLRMYCTFRCGS